MNMENLFNMVKYFIILAMLILADSFGFITQNENIHSECASAKLLQSEINTEFVMRIEYQPNQLINGLIFLEEIKSNTQRKALFRCKCGNEFETVINNVKMGKTRSCGCYVSKILIDRNTTHNLRYHPLYRVWQGMKRRCYNLKTKDYKNYGNRGIKVCNKWKNNFKVFYDWAIENNYKKGLTIDRENNDGNYAPDNCRFVTNAENIRNCRATKLTWEKVTEIRNAKLLLGNLVTQYELADAYGVKLLAISRLLRGVTWTKK